jgi:hypothetical protein
MTIRRLQSRHQQPDEFVARLGDSRRRTAAALPGTYT